MDVSLFKRLSERHPNAVIRLEHQYRMNQDIMELSNTLIYENRLKCGTGDVARALLQLPNWDELVSYVRENATDSTGRTGVFICYRGSFIGSSFRTDLKSMKSYFCVSWTGVKIRVDSRNTLLYVQFVN